MNETGTPKWAGSLAGVAVLTLVGCSYGGSEVKWGTPDKMPAQTRHEDIIVGAEGYFSSEKADHAFDADVISEGFLPVLLVVENGSHESVRIHKHQALLAAASQQLARPVAWSTMYRHFKEDVTTASVGLGLLGRTTAEDANDERAVDWREKELPAGAVVEPSAVAGGFIYFRASDNDGVGRPPYKLLLVLKKLESNETFKVVVKGIE